VGDDKEVTRSGMAGRLKRCTYEGCLSPDRSSKFHFIEKGRAAGGKDWSALVGYILCKSCHSRFERSGTLQRLQNRPLAPEARHCSYAGCDKPDQSSKFYMIEAGKKAGGQDWSELSGRVLCQACYKRFKLGGSLERSRTKPLPTAARKCTYPGCRRPEHGSKFYQIDKDKKAGGQDWSHIAGNVLCRACYCQYNRGGTLERVLERTVPAPSDAAANPDEAATSSLGTIQQRGPKRKPKKQEQQDEEESGGLNSLVRVACAELHMDTSKAKKPRNRATFT